MTPAAPSARAATQPRLPRPPSARGGLPRDPERSEPRGSQVAKHRTEGRIGREPAEVARVLDLGHARDDDAFQVGQHPVESSASSVPGSAASPPPHPVPPAPEPASAESGPGSLQSSRSAHDQLPGTPQAPYRIFASSPLHSPGPKRCPGAPAPARHVSSQRQYGGTWLQDSRTRRTAYPSRLSKRSQPFRWPRRILRRPLAEAGKRPRLPHSPALSAPVLTSTAYSAGSTSNAGCLGAMARIWSSLESGPVPSKKIPTSAFHLWR